MQQLVAPFPYFGGKRKVAAEIWSRFGDVRNYVEPFFGSGAVLLARPQPFGGVETVNDKDGFIANFWRAVQADPDAVTQWADWPVNEADLAARHYWLVTEGRDRLERILGDPFGYDAHVAGWWVWGACAWIGRGWCSGDGPWQWTGDAWAKDDAPGVNRQMPHVGNVGCGVNRQPSQADEAGVKRVLPHLHRYGHGIRSNGSRDFIGEMMAALSVRLRRVRVAHGDWTRVTGKSVTYGSHGRTAVFLDPPYSLSERDHCYATETDCAADVRAWAIEEGKRPDMLICLAGYDGEHAMPDDWTAYRWKTQGGYGNQGEARGRTNATRETLWFSPACLGGKQGSML